MKLWLLCLIIFGVGLTYGQTAIVFNGNAIPGNLAEWSWGQSTIEVVTGEGIDGANAIKWVQGDEWGNGWTGIGFTPDPTFNLADYWQSESVTLTMKAEEGIGALRIQYESGGDGKVGNVFTPIADNQWHDYTFPLKDMVNQDNTTNFNNSSVNSIGIMAEESAVAGKVLYIAQWYVTTEPSLIIFNGIAIPSNLEPWNWGGAVIEVEEGAGKVPGSNAVKWTQVDGGNGVGFTVDPMYDLTSVWATDSVKFSMKAEAGVDTMSLLFYDLDRLIIYYNFLPIADNEWHDYAVPLNQFIPDPASTTEFTPIIQYVELNTGVFAGTGHANQVVYITNWWTGNPVFDVEPPVSPAGISVAAGEFTNTITWTDVPDESLEKYNIYYSKNPITDVNAADIVELKVGEGVQEVVHSLRAPNTDQPVTYYYAITAVDGSGNISLPGSTPTAFTNTAKGVPTISVNPPAFVADGDLGEWSGITPIQFSPSTGGHTVSWGDVFSGDEDLSVSAYFAVDNTYFYFAFDAEDDIVDYSAAGTNQQDSPDLHIGLYDSPGPSHVVYSRGAEPDYLIRFAQGRVVMDLIPGGDSLMVPGENYFWGEKFPSGYSIEARIPWTLLAERAGDSVFVPLEGYQIPIDFLVNDADEAGFRQSMLTYSPKNDGNSWENVSVWSYTWIGNLSDPVAVNDLDNQIRGYALEQNYPNPFNPSTVINYNLEKAGMVSLKVYDILGNFITTLVNEEQPQGLHTVNFNAASLSSGVYFYQLTAGSFSGIRKMIFIK